MSDCQGKPEIKYLSASGGKCLTPFQRKLLLQSLHKSLPESYRQRIEIMLLADEGKTQTDICQTLGCCAATARHWTHIARTGWRTNGKIAPLVARRL